MLSSGFLQTVHEYVTKYQTWISHSSNKRFPPITTNELWHEISNNVVCATSKGSDQPAHTRSLIRAFASLLNILWVLLKEHHLEFPSLKRHSTG